MVCEREPDKPNIHNNVVEQSSTVQYSSKQPSISPDAARRFTVGSHDLYISYSLHPFFAAQRQETWIARDK